MISHDELIDMIATEAIEEIAAGELIRRQLVQFSFRDADLVCHLSHEECSIETPHKIETCGRFK